MARLCIFLMASFYNPTLPQEFDSAKLSFGEAKAMGNQGGKIISVLYDSCGCMLFFPPHRPGHRMGLLYRIGEKAILYRLYGQLLTLLSRQV